MSIVMPTNPTNSSFTILSINDCLIFYNYIYSYTYITFIVSIIIRVIMNESGQRIHGEEIGEEL